MNSTAFTTRLRDAADYLNDHGWTQNTLVDREGSVCLHGAIRACRLLDGDTEIVRAVLRHKGYTEQWNDSEERNADQVIHMLRTVTVTDDDLSDTFGPQWVQIVALIRRAALLTSEETKAWFHGTARTAAYNSAVYAAARAARLDMVHASTDATVNASRTLGVAAPNAALALTVRDLIGRAGFTRKHYDALTNLWDCTIGPVHPDD